jgi:hypothetical protein
MRRTKRGVGAVMAALLVVGAGLLAAAPVAPAAASPRARPTVIGCDLAATRVQVTASAVLDPSCTYTGGFDIRASNVVLDCRHALVQGPQNGIGIMVETPADVDMTNVTIRNCRVDGWLNGIHLRRAGFNSLPAGHEYDHRLDGVQVFDSVLTSSRGVGLYVDGYVTHTLVQRVIVHDAGSTGIYLDAGSRYGRVVQNVLVHNGYRENGDTPEGTVASVAGATFRFWGPGREGIAVDGSRDNVISGNWIVGNSAGGVFLYTNCGEYVHTDPADWVEHRFGAEDNHIVGNLITGGETGVWVGSRMGENVFPMDCSDVPYVSGPALAITLDRAPGTEIRSNLIGDTYSGIRIEDDGARVLSNLIGGVDATRQGIVVGTPYRTSVLHHPVTDTVVRGNGSLIRGNPSPYRWVDGVAALDARANTALGAPSAFCPAPDVPRGPFVMVYAVALQPPNGPPVPRPTFTVPRLGALAPCRPA